MFNMFYVHGQGPTLTNGEDVDPTASKAPASVCDSEALNVTATVTAVINRRRQWIVTATVTVRSVTPTPSIDRVTGRPSVVPSQFLSSHCECRRQ